MISKVNETQFRSFRGTAKIGGISLPNFQDVYVYTKKKSNMDEAAYQSAIVEQAKKDRAEGKFQNDSQGFNQLMKKYVSEVSPDRKGILTQGLKEIARQRSKTDKPLDVIALLMEGKVKYQDSGLGEDAYAEFYDDNGEMIATYSNGGWTMYQTKAETARQFNMCSIYNKAWNQAADISQATVEGEGACFDTKA